MYKLTDHRVNEHRDSGTIDVDDIEKTYVKCFTRQLKREKWEKYSTNDDIISSRVGRPRGGTRLFPSWSEDTDGGEEEERSQPHWSR